MVGIMEMMSKLGYKSDRKGMCQGLALAAAQACIRQEAQGYARRCEKIANLPSPFTINKISKKEHQDLRLFFDTVSVYHGCSAVPPDFGAAIGLSTQQQWSRMRLFQPVEEEKRESCWRIPRIALSSMCQLDKLETVVPPIDWTPIKRLSSYQQATHLALVSVCDSCAAA